MHIAESTDNPIIPLQAAEATETTGRVFPGPDGIIQIDFPADEAIKVGAEITPDVYAGVWTPTLDGTTGAWFYSDHAPEDDTKPYAVTACPEEAPAPVAEPASLTETVAPAGSNPQPTAGPSPAAQPAPATTVATLPFKAAPSIGSAKKVNKKRAIALKVTASKVISGLGLQLKKGSKVVATGRLASLSGTKTIKLKVGKKKLKKGSYTLLATGTVDGQALSATQTVTLGR